MKKLFLIFLFITGTLLGQTFTIPSLPNHGTLQGSDLFLISSSGGTYTKLPLTNFYYALQGFSLGYTWSTSHRFNSGVFIYPSGRFVLQNSNSPSYSGELQVTSGYGYLRFNSASNNDTLVTLRNMLRTHQEVYSTWDFNASTTIDGNSLYLTNGADLTLSGASLLFLGETGNWSATKIALWAGDISPRNKILYNYDGTTNHTDTLASQYWHVHPGYSSTAVTSTTLALSGTYFDRFEITTPVTSFTIATFSVTGATRGDTYTIIHTGTSGYTVTFQDGVSGLVLPGGNNVVLDQYDTLTLYYDGTHYICTGTEDNSP